AVEALARRVGGDCQVHFSDVLPRVAIFVSRQEHCLLDLLWRTRAGELPMQVPLVVSNHTSLQGLVEDFGARFVHLPLTSSDDKAAVEQAQLDLLAEYAIELVVLAK
ncbi:MAG: formyltetrahydrofolate deformylase, partial [bacterium]